MEGTQPFVASLATETVAAGNAATIVTTLLVVAALVRTLSSYTVLTTFAFAARTAATIISAISAETDRLALAFTGNTHDLFTFALTAHSTAAIGATLHIFTLRLADAEALGALLFVETVTANSPTAIVTTLGISAGWLADTNPVNTTLQLTFTSPADSPTTIIAAFKLSANGGALPTNVRAIARLLRVASVLVIITSRGAAARNRQCQYHACQDRH